MSTTEEVLSAALALPDADKLTIASRLLASVSPDLSSVDDDKWLDELNRRRDEFQQDRSVGVSWDDLKAELDA